VALAREGAEDRVAAGEPLVADRQVAAKRVIFTLVIQSASFEFDPVSYVPPSPLGPSPPPCESTVTSSRGWRPWGVR
jgi:hypothetical protein